MSSRIYNASNGVTFAEAEDGSWRWEAGMHPAVITEALRELFQWERDQALGRWRWPDDPEYVAYGEIQPAHEVAFGPNLDVMMFHEPTGVLKGYLAAEDEHRESRGWAACGRAYVAAHHDIPTEPNSVWVDKYGHDIWWVNPSGVFTCLASPSSDPAKYAPFTRLIQEAHDGV